MFIKIDFLSSFIGAENVWNTYISLIRAVFFSHNGMSLIICFLINDVSKMEKAREF
jgi:hypothetical protein